MAGLSLLKASRLHLLSEIVCPVVKDRGLRFPTSLASESCCSVPISAVTVATPPPHHNSTDAAKTLGGDLVQDNYNEAVPMNDVVVIKELDSEPRMY